jgi:predicted nuclease of restriction endonuclease-like RecB superfamily
MARLYSFLGIAWKYAPRTFDIGKHTYTPDFYLPDTDMYVEVKNFWGDYSRVRDTEFRKRYKEKLVVVLRNEYLQLEERCAKSIPAWEYKNSPPPHVT